MLSLLLLAAAPVLPAPFEKLEAVCLNASCSLAVYANKGVLTAPKKPVEAEEYAPLGVVTLAPGKKRCLQFTMGPSEDPQLVVLPEAACKTPFDDSSEPELRIAGEQFIVPGSTALYALGASNAMFKLRQKFVLGDKGWKAAAQPFFYVGEKVKVANRQFAGEPVSAVPLFAERKVGSEVVVTLAPGQTVEILLAEPDRMAQWFLVRTELGLVGWHHVPGTNVSPDALGLSYHGD